LCSLIAFVFLIRLVPYNLNRRFKKTINLIFSLMPKFSMNEIFKCVTGRDTKMVAFHPSLSLIRNRSLASSDIDCATEDCLLPKAIRQKNSRGSPCLCET